MSGIIQPKLLMSLFGLTFVALGLLARLGLWKNWYWRSRGTVYGYAPLGMLFLLYVLNDLAVARLGRYYILYQSLLALLVILGLWWSLRPPDFVKPGWVRWTEAYPQNVREAMAKAVAAGEAWEPHVRSPEALEAWARSLRGKKTSPKGKT